MKSVAGQTNCLRIFALGGDDDVNDSLLSLRTRRVLRPRDILAARQGHVVRRIWPYANVRGSG